MPDDTGELTPTDLSDFTRGRLALSDPLTGEALTAALAAVRRFCRWHVTPVKTDHVITLDGPGSALLILPTLNLTAVTSLTEDGVTVDPATYQWSALGRVRKLSGCRWSGKYRSIVATISHGFDSAPEFQRAVLSYADRSSFAATGGRARVVGPFQYDAQAMAAGNGFSVEEYALLSQYRLESPA